MQELARLYKRVSELLQEGIDEVNEYTGVKASTRPQ